MSCYRLRTVPQRPREPYLNCRRKSTDWKVGLLHVCSACLRFAAAGIYAWVSNCPSMKTIVLLLAVECPSCSGDRLLGNVHINS